MSRDEQHENLDEYEVCIVRPEGTTMPAHLVVRERDDGELVQISLTFDRRSVTKAGPECWTALCAIRRDLEQEGLHLACYGASRNVYPSGMARSMGRGAYAYRLTMGQAARQESLACIFDTGPDVAPATLEEQRQYFDAWLQSLQP